MMSMFISLVLYSQKSYRKNYDNSLKSSYLRNLYSTY